MSIKRQNRFYSQERVSVPALRSIESAVAADFDSVLRDFIAGTTNAYILKGFSLNIGSSTFSQSADNLTANTLNAAILHTLAIEAGTLLKITGSATEALNSSNSKVSGSFIAGSDNYVSINFIRKADTSTDTVYFYDKNSETEFSKLLPVDTILDYQIVINITGFDINVPVAIVTTNSSNVPTQIKDSRNMFFRLGTGGLNPDAFNNYAWLQGRTDPGVVTTSSASDPFTGADKNINIFKDWLDAVMTTLKEIKGTSYWFSLGSGGSSSGLSLLSVNDDANMSTWTGAGNIRHNLSITGQLISDNNIFIRNFVTDANFRVNTFTKSLSDGDVLFLNLSRYVDITGNVTIDPTGTLPGSLVGLNTRVIQASSIGQFVSLTNGTTTFGDWIKSKNDNARYFRQIDSFYDSVGSATTSVNATYLLLDSAYTVAGSSTGSQQIHYSKGNYAASDIITSSKSGVLSTYNVQNVYWLAYRDASNIYVRNMGRFVLGETRPVNENTSDNVLNFIGSSNEALTFPVYASSVVGAITTPTQVNYGGASTDNLTIRTSLLSTAMADKAQDKNVTLIGGGTLDNSSGFITWNASVTMVIGGPGTGITNYIPAGSADLSGFTNNCAYVTIDRNSIASLAVSVTTFANLPLTENCFVIARRLVNSDVWVGVGGQSYLISDGTNSTTGFSPSGIASLGIANVHKWKQEIPTGSINSLNTSFTISFTPFSVTALMVFKNGLFQNQGNSALTYDYSVTNSTNVVFYAAPNTGDEVVAVFARGNTVPYAYVQSLTVISETCNNTLLSPSSSYTRGVAVFLNGLQRTAGNNFDYTATATEIVWEPDLEPGDIVTCFYTGVNDNEIAEQGVFNESATSGRTIYTSFLDYAHPNSLIVSFDGVAQFPVNNTYGLTSSNITVTDYRILNTQIFEVGTASLTLGTVMYLWGR